MAVTISGRATTTHAAADRLPLSERRDVIVFRTPPLEADMEVTGTVEAKLWVGSTAADTDFTAKLIDEIPPNADYPLGFDLNLGDSILRARYREGLDHQAAPLDPSDIVPITITLYPTCERLQEGTPHQGRRVEQQLSAVRRQSQHRATRSATTGGWCRPTTRSITRPAHPSQVILPVIPAIVDKRGDHGVLGVDWHRDGVKDTLIAVILNKSDHR